MTHILVLIIMMHNIILLVVSNTNNTLIKYIDIKLKTTENQKKSQALPKST